MAGLAALGVLIAGVVIAGVLYSGVHWFLGIIALLGSLPVALVTWVMMKDRM